MSKHHFLILVTCILLSACGESSNETINESTSQNNNGVKSTTFTIPNKIKTDSIAKINKLTSLTKDETDKLIEQINQANNIEEVQDVLKNAENITKSNIINKLKKNTEVKITQLITLTQSEKETFIKQVNQYKFDKQLQNVLEGDKKINAKNFNFTPINKTKTNAASCINELPDWAQFEIDYFQQEMQNILNRAKNKNTKNGSQSTLNEVKSNAIAEISKLNTLTWLEQDQLEQQINQATIAEQVQNLLNSIKKKNTKNSTQTNPNTPKNTAINDVTKLNNLNFIEKEAYTEQIKNAKNNTQVENIINTAISRNNKINSSLDKEKFEVITKINLLQDLTNSEKNIRIKQINNASIGEINEIENEAEFLNFLNSKSELTANDRDYFIITFKQIQNQQQFDFFRYLIIKTSELNKLTGLNTAEKNNFNQQLRLSMSQQQIDYVLDYAKQQNVRVNDLFISSLQYQKGIYPPSESLKKYCATPRASRKTYFDPQGYPLTIKFFDRPGSKLSEKLWLRSLTNETYLWYKDAPDLEPMPLGESVTDYFHKLKTKKLTNSDKEVDQFHYAVPTEEYNISQGITATNNTDNQAIAKDFGFKLGYNAINGKIFVNSVEPNSPANDTNLTRGDELISINDINITDDLLSEHKTIEIKNILTEPIVNQQYKFVFKNSKGKLVTDLIAARPYKYDPVSIINVFNNNTKKFGYLQFNRFVAVAQDDLIDAFEYFKSSNIDELVLDLRQNGGGLISLASQLAYMIKDPIATSPHNLDKDRSMFNFVSYMHNDKVQQAIPESEKHIPFINEKIDYMNTNVAMQSLPTLNLKRVFILSSRYTCSASELVINGLRAIKDIEVILIGDTTCGKPYGFVPTDNCSTTYMTIQEKSTNNDGFGDYADGLVPTEIPKPNTVEVKGCKVADNPRYDFLSNNETLLKTALYYAENNKCPSHRNSNNKWLVSSAIDGRSMNPIINKAKLFHRITDSWKNNAFITKELHK